MRPPSIEETSLIDQPSSSFPSPQTPLFTLRRSQTRELRLREDDLWRDAPCAAAKATSEIFFIFQPQRKTKE